MRETAMLAHHAAIQLRLHAGLRLASRRSRRLAGLMLAALFPVAAQAQTVSGGADPTTMIKNVCTFILGPFGQTLAVLGIIGIGLAWMFGRVSMSIIAGVIGGIVVMFGAAYLGQTLTGG